MFIFTIGMSITNLLSFASSASRTVTQEAREMAANSGAFAPGLMNNDDVNSVVSEALANAKLLNDAYKQAYPGIPDYSSNTFNPPANMTAYLTGAMDTVDYIQNKLAQDPAWTGDKTEATLREERQLELMEEQNETMKSLDSNIKTLNSNTDGLPELLGDLSAQSTRQTSIMDTLLNRVGEIQQWLLNLEQQLANQTQASEAAAEASEAAAAAAAAAAEAVELAAEAANNANQIQETAEDITGTILNSISDAIRLQNLRHETTTSYWCLKT